NNSRVQDERRLVNAIEQVNKRLDKMLLYISADAEPPATLVREIKGMEEEKLKREQELALLRAGSSVFEEQKEMAKAKKEIEMLVRAGDTKTRKRLRG